MGSSFEYSVPLLELSKLLKLVLIVSTIGRIRVIGDNSIFSSVIFCYFLDRGPTSIDFFFPGHIAEDPNLTAVRLMTKSTAMVKGDSSQQVEQSITNQLSGPDIYPVDPKYRMVWYNWLISNQFSNDPRIKNTGAMAGVYCIYKKKNEETVRSSLKIIERVLKDVSLEFKTIDDIIKKKLSLSASTKPDQYHFSYFIEKNDTHVISKEICISLNEKAIKYSDKTKYKYIPRTAKFKVILQTMVLKKGTPEEFSGQTRKRQHWTAMIQILDRLIKGKITKRALKDLNEKDLDEIYNILTTQKLWSQLPLGKVPPSVQEKDVSLFFFYYWLAHHNLLKRKKVVNYVQKIMN